MPGRFRTGYWGIGRNKDFHYVHNWPDIDNPAPDPQNRFYTGVRGRCCGWRHRFYATGIPGWSILNPEQEAENLKVQADWLKRRLEAIQKRLDELQSKSKTNSS